MHGKSIGDFLKAGAGVLDSDAGRSILPFAVWMALMTALPATAAAYAVRAAVTAAALVWALWGRVDWKGALPAIAWGVPAGLLVCAIWVAPERWGWYRAWCVWGEGGTAAVAEASAVLIAVRLLGSAFVISVAEELFFRRWLIGFAGFWAMVALFAVEHDRWLVGAIAGAAYGALYLRKGLGAAAVAHAVTNLALGVWVLLTGAWELW